ncbi:MAG: trigger factor [Opitutaceae bacterium]|nr:trigger factor [Opitutaceae bacterium]
MNIEIKDVSATRKQLVVSLDQGEVAAEHKAVLAEYTRHARIPGFRPGKAPASLILRQFGKGLADEFKQRVTSKAYRDGLKESKLDVLKITALDGDDAIAPDAAVTLTFTVDVHPVFTLPEYNALPTEIAPVEPDAADIDAMIEGLRSERAEFKTSAAPAGKGDYVKLSYEGAIDGKPVAELVPDKQIYGKVPQTWEEVEGEHEGVIPGLGKHLAGVQGGDKKTVEINFPAAFEAAPALAGKTAAYAIEVLEIRTRKLPALDEAFFKSQEVASLDELKTKVRDSLKSRREHENRQRQRNQIQAALNARVDIEAPLSLVEEETQNVLRNVIGENMRRGVPEEEFEKHKKELYDNARAAAEKRVKTRLILAGIAKQENIEVSDADLDAFIYREAMMNRTTPEKLAKELSGDNNRLLTVRQAIIFDKTLDLLVSKAAVTTAEPKPAAPAA